jgi:hypothetical protein
VTQHRLKKGKQPSLFSWLVVKHFVPELGARYDLPALHQHQCIQTNQGFVCWGLFDVSITPVAYCFLLSSSATEPLAASCLHSSKLSLWSPRIRALSRAEFLIHFIRLFQAPPLARGIFRKLSNPPLLVVPALTHSQLACWWIVLGVGCSIVNCFS